MKTSSIILIIVILALAGYLFIRDSTGQSVELTLPSKNKSEQKEDPKQQEKQTPAKPPARLYESQSVEECVAMVPKCPNDTQSFSDETGCGCEYNNSPTTTNTNTHPPQIINAVPE